MASNAIGSPAKSKRVKKKAAPKETVAQRKSLNETLSVNGHDVKLTNQQKVYWPKEGTTKGQVLNYYNKISKLILPYLKDRPQSLKRNPNGITD